MVSSITGKLDPQQFAYQPGNSVEDAKLFILNTLHKHLEIPGTHARLLFALFSSTFKKMQPHILIERLDSYFNLPYQLGILMLSSLIGRVQE